MSEPKGPTLEQIAGLKLRLRTLPDELNVAREAAARLGAEVKDARSALAEQEAEVGAMCRAELKATGKKPPETAIAAGVKAAIEKDAECRRLRDALRNVQLRHDGAELQVKHLEDRFRGLQVYADLTACEVRLLVNGLAV